MSNTFRTICFAMMITGPALAGERTVTISCRHTSQATFDSAVTMIDSEPLKSGSIFEDMVRSDRGCAILHWGIAMTAAEPGLRQRATLDALLAAAIGHANEMEWSKISLLR